jgi:putative ABC transport system ATP-binding protein
LDPVAAFRLDDVSVRKGEAVLLSHVSMEIPTGRCTALVGPSGAGKSTLLRLLNRFEEPTSGRIEYRAIPLTTPDVLVLRRRVVLVAQRPTLLATKVDDDVRTGAPDLGSDQVLALLARVGLDASFAERASATLSGGEAQRVCLARSKRRRGRTNR